MKYLLIFSITALTACTKTPEQSRRATVRFLSENMASAVPDPDKSHPILDVAFENGQHLIVDLKKLYPDRELYRDDQGRYQWLAMAPQGGLDIRMRDSAEFDPIVLFSK